MSAVNQETKQGDMQELSLLLEIGTEEIPARFLPVAIADLKGIAAELFTDSRVEYREIKSYATPRRLVLMMKGVAPKQNEAVREVFGPSKKVAFDEQGSPTRAATGFASSLGIPVSELVVKTKGKSEYVAAIITESTADTKAVLPDLFRKIILALRFPKSMRWGSGSMLFVRPIHWIVALCGQETIPLELDGIKSGNMTRGHRFLSPAAFQIKEVSAYGSLLENNFVVLDPEKRERLIRGGIEELSAKSGGRPVADDGLLETVTFLVEYPVPVLCGFDREYLKLPKELLITVMKDHQKYFGIQDEDGNLLNSFIVISNTRAENGETVRTGAQRVIKARFDDAKFYYHEDKKSRLIDRVEGLKNVTFHDKLGSLFAKTERVVSLASFFADAVAPGQKEKLLRAANLAKADLTAGVVREFPELQGVMGKYYAQHDEEDKAVSLALEEQYLPKSFGGRLPETDLGALLSLSDKVDNIASFFSIGLMPTGSEDPFALRRQAMGIVSVLIDRGYPLPLGAIFENALQHVPAQSGKNVSGDILDFMAQRLEFALSSKEYDQELTKAVLPLSRSCPLKSVVGRIEALKQFRQEERYPSFLLAIKRVNNIIPKTALPALRSDLFVQTEEKELHEKFTGVNERMSALILQEDFSSCLSVLSEITEAVNVFFDKILVMDKQEEIKLNRLALLTEIWSAASRLADFSKLS
ncbi:MAG: glycine--tRNA ligase subunit beta [Nitrospiraceae bacterium]|nr:glycine--tRNA ligase subunit beta [Nitrospiraceae bacterium]